jgi:PAS domain S-box-containing protein
MSHPQELAATAREALARRDGPAPWPSQDQAAEGYYRRHLEAIADNATLALFVMDEQQRCTYMNPAAERLTGFTLQEVRGKPLHDYVHHTRPDGSPYPLEECPIDRAFPENMREQGEEVFVHPDGHFYPVAFTASPILEDGRPVGTIIEVRDISEERKADAERQRRERELALSVAVGRALTLAGTLSEMLQQATDAVVEYLDAAFARIWTVDEAGTTLELQASAGMYTHLDGDHARVPIGKYKIGKIASERAPHLTNDVVNDPRVSDHEWARTTGIVSFAGYPLMASGRLMGVLAMFARHPLPQAALDALGAVASSIAVAIDRAGAAAERERYLEEIQVERARLATVFEQAPAFMATLRGPDHVFESANPAYYRIVGVRNLIGLSVREALPEIEGQGFVELLDEVYCTGEPFIGDELPVQLASGAGGTIEEHYVNFVYQPLTDVVGQVSGILVHGVDVTDLVDARREAEAQAGELEAQAEELQHQAMQMEETQAELEVSNEELRSQTLHLEATQAALESLNGRLVEANQELRRQRGAADDARREAERANRTKSEFLATMSHELRTPLNAMIGYSELLLAGVPDPITPGAAQKVERIGIAARHLLQLIEEILTFSRIEAGEERVEVEAVDLAVVFAEVIALTEPLALAKGLGFTAAGIDVGGAIQTDARKLKQVLVNLLGNAIKFTEEGGVSLTVEHGEGALRFRVRDTGPGIPAEDLDRVFEPFWQAEPGRVRESGGTGLGLSVSQRLARLLGGDITVVSEEGRGTIFELALPVGGAH